MQTGFTSEMVLVIWLWSFTGVTWRLIHSLRLRRSERIGLVGKFTFIVLVKF